MPLQKLQFRPGVNREGTTLANEGGWFESDKVRFRSGYPEKIGGWVKDTGSEFPTDTATGDTLLQPPTGSYWGVCRAMWNWLNLVGFNLVGLGTNLKYYIQNSINGSFYDVTPIRQTTAIASNAFTTVNGSTTVTVNATAHNAIAGDFILISGVSGAVNGIPDTSLNKEFRIVTILSGSSFTITVDTAATSSGTAGACTVNYQMQIGGETATTANGWGAGGWGGVLSPSATTTLNGALNSSATTITVVSTTGFAASDAICIEGEYITYSGVTSTTFTGCTRGYNSTAAAHNSGTSVFQYVGATGWGQGAAIGFAVNLRLWSQSNFGENLIFNARGGAMNFWAVNPSPTVFDRGQVITPGGSITQKNYATGSGTTTVSIDSTCPTQVNYVMVSDSSRFTIAFGCNDPTGVYATQNLDPMQIRWADQESYSDWTPASTNQAGAYRLSHGSQIVTAIQTRQEILVWTDTSIYSMQFLGAPYVWGFQIMGDNLSIISPNAPVTVNNITYWMGTDKFYMYSGRVETLPCSLRQYIYDDINLDQGLQVTGGSNEGYNEIWWFYCSANSTTVDKYVIYNHLERTWAYGTLARTAWLDSPLRQVPMAAGYNGQLIYHETGNDDGTTTPPSAIYSYVRSSDFDIGDGHNFGLVWRIIPDLTFDGSTVNAPTVNFTVLPRQNPGTNYGSSDNPSVASAQNYAGQRTYNIQQFTEYAYVRIRGRQMAFQISSSDLGVSWQLGAPRLDVRPDGRR